jgi:hypothetical protein
MINNDARVDISLNNLDEIREEREIYKKEFEKLKLPEVLIVRVNPDMFVDRSTTYITSNEEIQAEIELIKETFNIWKKDYKEEVLNDINANELKSSLNLQELRLKLGGMSIFQFIKWRRKQ